MKTKQKKKFRIGRIISIIISVIILRLSLQPLGDDGAFGRMIYLVPLSIAAWLFFLGRENVFDYRETGETYEEDYDIVTEDLFGGKHLETYTSTHNESEGGFIEHSMKASWVFIPLCALDTFFCKVPGGIGFYWLIPAILIVLNIWLIIEDFKPPKDKNNKTTELATKEVDDKSTNFKDVGAVKVEGARAQYYFEEVRGQYLFTRNAYKIEGNTATSKLYSISGPMISNITFGCLSISDNNGDIVGCVNCQDTTTQDTFEIRDTHEIGASGKMKYKMIGGAFTDCTITDPDGNKLAYYKVISIEPQNQQGIYGPNDEPYAVLDDNKILSIMKNCPIDDKSVMLMIASILKSNIVKILGL